MIKKLRNKTWAQKQALVRDAFLRSVNECDFAHEFYKNLFFLRPSIEDKFTDTDRAHQKKALLHGLDHLLNYSIDDPSDEQIYHVKQILRISQTHAKNNLNIEPHLYYYWIDAFLMTTKEHDPSWHDDLQYYTREVLFAPISFIISMYHSK